MGPVEHAIRAHFQPPAVLYTRGQRAPFVLERVDHDGIVLLLGEGRHWTPISWTCLEGVIPFLCRFDGWIPAGGTYTVEGARGTLDEHLKAYINRQTSRWVAVVLAEAAIVDLSPGRPLELRLRAAYR